MPGCPKHTKGLSPKCAACKKIDVLWTRVARDTQAGRKITYFHPFKKPEIDLKIKLLEEEAKAREISPYCAKHFPTGGVRCQDCLNRQLTPEQRLHRDVQATLFGTPLPLRPFELEHAERFVNVCSKRFPSGAISVQDIEGLLTAMGYKPWAIIDFIKILRTLASFKHVPSLVQIASNPLVSGLPTTAANQAAVSLAAAAVSAANSSAASGAGSSSSGTATSGSTGSSYPTLTSPASATTTQSPQGTISGFAGLVSLHDIKMAVQNRPPRLVSPANVDGLSLADLRHEFDAVDMDKSGGISRQEFQEMLFMHGMDEVRSREFTNRYFEARGKSGENDELTFSDFYNGFMHNLRRRALRRIKRFALQVFGHADADQDGWLTLRDVALHASSLLGVHVTRDRVPELFAEMDVTSRGRINLQELFDWHCTQLKITLPPQEVAE